MRRRGYCLLGAVLFAVGASTPAMSQPFDVFVDPISGESCDLVNAGNVELVVYSDTGELVIVTGVDLFLGDSFVSGNGDVFFDGLPFGFITFAEDGDGFLSLFWLTDFGTVVDIDLSLFYPVDSGLFPEEFVGVPCDACPFWDDPFDCAVFDTDGDGVEDEFDLCLNTGPGEIVDVDGCSCEDIGDCDCFFDTDLDEVPDCEDFCNDTPIGADVDFDGCACFEVDDDGDGIDNCDDLCPNTPGSDDVDIDGCSVIVNPGGPVFISCGNISALFLGLTFSGLIAMRFAGRRFV